MKDRRLLMIVSIGLIGASVVAAVSFALVATKRALTPLEGALFQALSLIAGLLGSYLFGRQSMEDAARGMIKPHARSAFRRVLSLYSSLSRLAQVVENAREAPGSTKTGTYSPFDTLKAVVIEQIFTAGDAIEDWRDIVPDEVEAVEKRVRADAERARDSQSDE